MSGWIDVLATGWYRAIFPCGHDVIAIGDVPAGQPKALFAGQQVEMLICPRCWTLSVLERVVKK